MRLSLDNVAFVVDRLAASIEEECVPWLLSMSQGELRPPPQRTAYMIDSLESAAESLGRAIDQMRAVQAQAKAE